MNPMTSNTVSIWVASLDIWPLVIVLVPNLMFRRYGNRSGKKRMASLLQAIAVFAITTGAGFVAVRELTDLYFYIITAVVIVVLVIFRAKVFPYRRSCIACGAKLDIETIYFREPDLCISCRAAESDEADIADADNSADGDEKDADEEAGDSDETVNTAFPGSGPDPEDDGDEPA